MSWFRLPKNADERRNFGCWITEKLTITPIWSKYLFDLRLGFKRNNKWQIGYLSFWRPVTQNFWNGIFTLNVYLVTNNWMVFPRINIVSRFSKNHWFQFGIGILFDRGEFGMKLVIANWENEEKFNPGCNAKGWEEGPV